MHKIIIQFFIVFIQLQGFEMFEWAQTVQTFKVYQAYNCKATPVFFQAWRVEI